MNECQFCGKAISKGDHEVNYGEINEYQEDEDLYYASESDSIYVCQPCFKLHVKKALRIDEDPFEL